MLAANAAVLLGAHALLRRIRTGTATLDILLFLMLRFLIVGAAVLAAALAGQLKGWVLGVAGCAALAVLLAAGEQRRLPSPRIPELPRFVAVLLALIGVRLLLQVWFFAPFGTDPLSYHLPKIAEWVREGRMVHASGIDVRETFPAGFELIETWWVVFLHHDVLIEMAGLEFLALGFAAVAALARSLGLAAPAAALAALLYSLTPGVHLLAVSCMNDTPVAALFLSAAALVASRAHPLLVLLPAGLGIGMKPTFAYMAPGLLLLGWLVRRDPPRRPESRGAAAAVAAASLCSGAFWYLRNVVLFGSPIYPIGRTPLIEPMPPFLRVVAVLGIRLADFVDAGVADRIEPYTSLLARESGWGLAVFSAGAVALVVELRERPRLRALAAGFAVSLVATLLFSHPKFYFYRFVLFFPAVFCLALASLCERRPAFSAVPRLLGVLLLLSTVLPYDVRPHLERMLAQGWRERAFENEFDAVPRGEPIACLYGFNADFYSAAAPDFHRPLQGIRDAATPEDLRDQLRSRGIRWLYTKGDPESSRIRSIVRQATAAGYLRRHEQWLYECPGP
jgi:hypothetical protein